jgi:hypothetical protein
MDQVIEILAAPSFRIRCRMVLGTWRDQSLVLAWPSKCLLVATPILAFGITKEVLTPTQCAQYSRTSHARRLFPSSSQKGQPLRYSAWSADVISAAAASINSRIKVRSTPITLLFLSNPPVLKKTWADDISNPPKSNPIPWDRWCITTHQQTPQRTYPPHDARARILRLGIVPSR